MSVLRSNTPPRPATGTAANTPVYGPIGGTPWLRVAKRAADIAMAGSFFVFFGWAYALIWLGVRMTSGGPANTLCHGRPG